jgi:hypothetical protein
MPAERRQTPRYRIGLNVLMHVGGGGRTLTGRSVDLSRAGIFVHLSEAVTEGHRVEMMLEADNHVDVLFVTGVVVHAVPGYGVGIRFSALSARADGRLVELLARLEAAEPNAAA